MSQEEMLELRTKLEKGLEVLYKEGLAFNEQIERVKVALQRFELNRKELRRAPIISLAEYSNIMKLGESIQKSLQELTASHKETKATIDQVETALDNLDHRLQALEQKIPEPSMGKVLEFRRDP